MKTLLAVLALTGALWAQLPDAPSAVKPSGPQYPKSVPWKQAVDKKFVAVHLLFLGTVVGDEVATLRGEEKGCAIEANPIPHYANFGDLARRDYPIWAGLTVFDLVMKKAGVKYAWFSAATVGSAIHLYGVAQWYNTCRIEGVNLLGK